MAKKLELTDTETKLIASIPSAKKAATIWAKFAERRLQAKADRTALGEQLVAVRKALGTTKGIATGGKGLFHRWLRTTGITHDRAYAYMALAGGAAPKGKRKSYLRGRGFHRFQSLLFKARTNEEKVEVLNDLIKWVKQEYRIHD